jgi:HAD superfamily hydrolase (TIGR01509 family)
MPGVTELLRALRSAGWSLAMATSADQVKAMANLRILGMENQGFDAVVTGDDVHLKKPHPDIYLEAAGRCGVAPGDAWVIEDAESGVRSGKAAGMRVIGLTSTLPASRLLAAGADAVVDRLDQVACVLGL